MPFSIEDSDLWKKTLAPQEGDLHREARDLLRSTLLQMRSTVSQLVTEIPADCKDLTIHDISHLDALWEMADLLAGPSYELTPVEAFVFGASVLLHDAGLAFAAYPGGLQAIKETLEWKDTAEAYARRRRDSTVTYVESNDERDIAFEVLRRLHAQQAEKLATQSWPVGKSGDQVHLISNLEIRQAYGRSIGKIAHSHHWSIDKVAEDLRDGLGASPELPREWTLSEKKVACLLRCADISHIDRRRAPTILMSSKEISAGSLVHWQFQNKINKPVPREGALIYNSGGDFDISEADAWWLAYEVLRAVDVELRTSNALLSEQRLPIFEVQRVAGTDTPRSLSKFITTKGWKPVDTEIRVTDPIHLARTLGGANLYGSDTLAPIRELIQNAVDAIRARRRMETRSPFWGSVSVRFETDENGHHLIVDDNGTGMSERVLTGPLLDFGKSLWNSNLLQEEFPGLQTLGIDPVGKFGIGFFSVFLLGNDVTITTRKYSATDPYRTLAFNGLSRRPVLRDALKEEIPLDYSTRIRVKLSKTDLLVEKINLSETSMFRRQRPVLAADILRTILSCVDVDIRVEDKQNDIDIDHKADWLTTSSKDFLNEISYDFSESWTDDEIISAHKELITEIRDSNGKLYGRAALNVTPSLKTAASHYSRVSVGGFVTSPAVEEDPFYIGVMQGETDVASRNTSKVSIPREVLKSWADSQVGIIDRKKIHPSDQFALCHRALSLGADTKDLPFCLSSDGLMTVHQFRDHIDRASEIFIPVNLKNRDYGESEKKIFYFAPLSALSQDVLFYKLTENLIALVDTESDLLRRDPEESEIETEYSEKGFLSVDAENLTYPRELGILVRELKSHWGAIAPLTLTRSPHLEMKLYRRATDQWVLRLARTAT